MGLDITAYENLRSFKPKDSEIDSEGYLHHDIGPLGEYRIYLSEELIRMHDNHFPGRSEGLSPGYFRSEEAYNFHAGSYSSYNDWRNELDKNAKHFNGAFHELINFSDCEGVMGPKVSEKLFDDFVKYYGFFKELYEDDSVFWYLYKKWLAAFSISSQNGCVRFW